MSGIPGSPPPSLLCLPVCDLARLGPGATSTAPGTTPDLWEMPPGCFKVHPVTTIISITTTVTTMASATPRHPRPRQGLTRRPVCPMGPRDLDRPISRTRKPRVNEASEKPARASCSLEKAKLGFRPPESLCPETCDLVTPSQGLAAPVKGVAPSQGYRGARMGPEGFRDKRLLPPPGTSPV